MLTMVCAKALSKGKRACSCVRSVYSEHKRRGASL